MGTSIRACRPALVLRSVFTAIGFCVVASCAPAEPRSASVRDIRSVPMHVLVRNIEDYRGQTVRACGRGLETRTRPDGTVVQWELRATDPSERFGAALLIAPCGDETPQLENGCIVGRIARENGSLEIPTTRVITDHLIISKEWWLHPQCPQAPP